MGGVYPFHAVIMALAAACTLAMCVHGSGFVQRQGSQLVLDGRPFYFVGFNAYWLVDAIKTGDYGAAENLMQRAQDLGMKVGRTWAFNHNLPSSPGVYDEHEFQSVDNVIAKASQHGLKLVLVLGNFWQAYLGPEKFMGWAGISGDVLDFYTNSATRELYKQHLQAMVTRVNSVTGVAYKDDPTIMAWNIMNEPRCPGCMDAGSQAIHLSWLNEMSSFLKGVDSQHLVVVGSEGFYMADAEIGYNPGAGTACEGEDWSAEYGNVATLDYSNIHVYSRQHESVPPSWVPCDRTCYLNWAVPSIRLKAQQAQQRDKPLVLEEFGASPLHEPFTPQQGVEYFALIFDLLKQSKASGGALMGAMFWTAEVSGWFDSSGYNVALDGDRSATLAATPPLNTTSPGSNTTPNTSNSSPTITIVPIPVPPIVVTFSSPAYGGTSNNNGSSSSSPGSPGSSGQGSNSNTHRKLLIGADAPESAVLPSVAASRNLLDLDMALDDFRRGPQRAACAATRLNNWQEADGWGSRGNSVDIGMYETMCAGKTVLDIIADATSAVNS